MDQKYLNVDVLFVILEDVLVTMDFLDVLLSPMDVLHSLMDFLLSHVLDALDVLDVDVLDVLPMDVLLSLIPIHILLSHILSPILDVLLNPKDVLLINDDLSVLDLNHRLDILMMH
jgi:hypothetical protein